MIRWIRLAAGGALVVSLVAVGVGLGLFLRANGGWIAVAVPEWLQSLFGNPELELWIPALISGWVLSVFFGVGLILLSMFYIWRRRQYERLIGGLERELSELRNMPFTAPAPLEDLPEVPAIEGSSILSIKAPAASAIEFRE